MVCKKCGTKIEKDTIECSNCGEEQTQDEKEQFDQLKRELENLKMGEAPSSLSNGKVHPNIKSIPKIDIPGVIKALEKLKVEKVEPLKLNDKIEQDIGIDSDTLEKTVENDYDDQEVFVQNNNLEYDVDNYKVDDSYNSDEKIYIETTHDIKPNLEVYDIKLKNNYKKGNNRNIVMWVSIFAFLFIIGLLALYSLLLSPKAKFVNALKGEYSNIINRIDNITKDVNDIIKSPEIELNITSKVTNTENGITDNYIITTKYLESEKEQKQYFEYSNLNKNKSELKKLYIQNNNLYINQENSTDKYYIVNSKYISLKNFLNTNNIDYVFKIISKNCNKILKNNNFTTRKTTLTLDDKNYKVREISLLLDEKLYSKIYTEILDDIKTDKTALHILTDYSKYSMDDIIKIIDEKQKLLKDQKSNKVKYTYKIYINDDNKVIKQELGYDNNIIEFSNIKNKQELKVTNDNSITLLLDAETKDNKTTFNIKTDNEIRGEFIKDKSSNILNFQITDKKGKQWIFNSSLVKNKNDNNQFNSFISIQSKGFNNRNYIQNIENVSKIESTSHFEIIDIPIQQNISPLPVNIKNELSKNFSWFIK